MEAQSSPTSDSIGADIVVPKRGVSVAPKTRPAARPVTGDLAAAGIQKAAQKNGPRNEAEVVRVAGQSGALQVL